MAYRGRANYNGRASDPEVFLVAEFREALADVFEDCEYQGRSPYERIAQECGRSAAVIRRLFKQQQHVTFLVVDHILAGLGRLDVLESLTPIPNPYRRA